MQPPILLTGERISDNFYQFSCHKDCILNQQEESRMINNSNVDSVRVRACLYICLL